MEMTFVWGCIAFLLSALFYLLYVLVKLRQDLAQNVSAATAQSSEFARDLKILKMELEEVRQANVGMGKTIKTLGQYFSQLEQKFNEVELFEPESKLYSRAAKLAEKGASVEEIMTECEIPRAEAELVLSLRNKMSR